LFFKEEKVNKMGNIINSYSSLDVPPRNGGQTLLGRASSDKNRALIESLLENGANINAPDKRGRSPLWYATENEDLDTVKYLVSRGANPRQVAYNQTDLDDWKDETSPLSLAIYKGNREIYDFYLNKQANIEKEPRRF